MLILKCQISGFCHCVVEIVSLGFAQHWSTVGSWCFRTAFSLTFKGQDIQVKVFYTGGWDLYMCWNISNVLTHTVHQPRRVIILLFIWLPNCCQYFCEFYFCGIYCIFLNIFLSWPSLSHVYANAVKEFKIAL